MPVYPSNRSRSPSLNRARAITIKEDPAATMIVKMHKMKLEGPCSPELSTVYGSCSFDSSENNQKIGQLWMKKESNYSFSRPNSAFGSRRGSFSLSDAGSEVKFEPPSRPSSVDILCFPPRPGSRCSKSSGWEPEFEPRDDIGGSWLDIMPKLVQLGFDSISQLNLTISDECPLKFAGLVTLPNCFIVHLTTLHPADLAQFKLPRLKFLGLVADDGTRQDLSQEIEELVATPSISAMKPQQMVLTLPIDGPSWIRLLQTIGRDADRIKITPLLLSAMTAEFPTALMDMKPSAGRKIPSVLPLARQIRISLSNCKDYTPVLLETAQTQLKLAAAKRRECNEANLVITGTRTKCAYLTV